MVKTKGVNEHKGKLRIYFNWAEDPTTKPIRHIASTGFIDTQDNRMRAYYLRLQILELIENNKFNVEQYCLFLPKSSFAKKHNKLHDSNDLSYLDAVDLYMQYFTELTDQGIGSPTSRGADYKVLTGATANTLKEMSLQNIKGKHIHAMQRSWEALKEDGSKVRNKTINNRIDAFKAMFKYLNTKLEIIKDNPTLTFERRSIERNQPEVFDADLMSNIYQDLYINEGATYANLYAIICLLGVRVGEACAISEEDIDYNTFKVCINRALVIDKKALTEKEKAEYIKNGKIPPKFISNKYWKGTKTGSSRDLDCSSVVLDIFREQKLLNRKSSEITELVHRGGNINNESFKPLFTHSVRGKSIIDVFNSKTAQNMYDRSKKRLGIKPGEVPSIKNGRSTNASVIASKTGNVFKIQAQLGHSDIGTLQKHYAKFLETHEKVDIDAIFIAAREAVVPQLLFAV